MGETACTTAGIIPRFHAMHFFSLASSSLPAMTLTARRPEAFRTVDDIRENLLPLVGDAITAMCLARSADPLGYLINHLSQARAGQLGAPLQVSAPQWGAPVRARRTQQASGPTPPQSNEVSELVARVVQRAETHRQHMSETQRKKTNAVGEAWKASNWLEARGASRSISDSLLGPLLKRVKSDEIAVDETLELELVKVGLPPAPAHPSPSSSPPVRSLPPCYIARILSVRHAGAL